MQEKPPKTVTLVLGGVRSGKSRYAQQLADRFERVVFIATARIGDEEMRAKVRRHQAERPPEWLTVEEPLELAQALEQHGPSCDVLLVDCLTIFAANLMEDEGEDGTRMGGVTSREATHEARIEQLCNALQSVPCSVVLVSNEVGSGVVPPYPLGRRFRDVLGELNQRVARVADDVLLLVAGLPLALKGHVEVDL